MKFLESRQRGEDCKLSLVTLKFKLKTHLLIKIFFPDTLVTNIYSLKLTGTLSFLINALNASATACG